MGKWLKVGSKKLGVEFAYIAGSTVFIFVMHHYLILQNPEQGDWEAPLFYFIFSYNLVTYLALAFSDPGRIDAKKNLEYLTKLDQMVSFPNH
jgi:hypothetical protein